VVSDPLAQLLAQREHFASDDHIREEVRIWSDTSPEDRLRELAAMSADNDAMLENVDDAALERMRRLRTPSPDTIAILEQLAKAAR
jgi:hypothetical protein